MNSNSLGIHHGGIVSSFRPRQSTNLMCSNQQRREFSVEPEKNQLYKLVPVSDAEAYNLPTSEKVISGDYIEVST